MQHATTCQGRGTLLLTCSIDTRYDTATRFELVLPPRRVSHRVSTDVIPGVMDVILGLIRDRMWCMGTEMGARVPSASETSWYRRGEGASAVGEGNGQGGRGSRWQGLDMSATGNLAWISPTGSIAWEKVSKLTLNQGAISSYCVAPRRFAKWCGGDEQCLQACSAWSLHAHCEGSDSLVVSEHVHSGPIVDLNDHCVSCQQCRV